jgi:multisubunit Na+/H+ antiporter MnhF subunit
MNAWLWAGAGMLGLLAPCALIAVRGSIFDRLLGLELAGPISSTAFVALSEGFDRSIYFDLALVYTVTSFISTLVIVRFLERLR